MLGAGLGIDSARDARGVEVMPAVIDDRFSTADKNVPDDEMPR